MLDELTAECPRDLIDEYLAEFRERTLEKIRSGETTDAKAPEEVTA